MGEVIQMPKLEHRAVCTECTSQAWSIILDGPADSWQHIVGFICCGCGLRMMFDEEPDT